MRTFNICHKSKWFFDKSFCKRPQNNIKMTNAKIAFWTAREIETVAFYMLIFPLKLNL